jgi:hypothetical protein
MNNSRSVGQGVVFRAHFDTMLMVGTKDWFEIPCPNIKMMAVKFSSEEENVVSCASQKRLGFSLCGTLFT